VEDQKESHLAVACLDLRTQR